MKKHFIIFIGIVVILFLGLTTLFLINKKEDKNIDYIVHYYTGSLIYDLKVRKDILYIEKKEYPNCFKAPCDPVNVDKFRVTYKKEYQELIKNLFKDKNTKEISITNKDLSEEELKIMSNIVKME